MNASILTHDNFQECLAFVLANRMSNPTMPDIDYGGCFLSIFNESDEIVQAALDDLQAVRERVGFSLYGTAISGNMGLTVSASRSDMEPGFLEIMSTMCTDLRIPMCNPSELTGLQ